MENPPNCAYAHIKDVHYASNIYVISPITRLL